MLLFGGWGRLSLAVPLLWVHCTSFFSEVYDGRIHIAISLRITKITHVRVKQYQARYLRTRRANHIYGSQFPKEITSAKRKGHLQYADPKFQSRLHFNGGYRHTVYTFCPLITRSCCLFVVAFISMSTSLSFLQVFHGKQPASQSHCKERERWLI